MVTAMEEWFHGAVSSWSRNLTVGSGEASLWGSGI